MIPQTLPATINTVDGRNPAPRKKPWNDDFSGNTTKNGFPWFQSGAGFRASTVGMLPGFPCSSLAGTVPGAEIRPVGWPEANLLFRSQRVVVHRKRV